MTGFSWRSFSRLLILVLSSVAASQAFVVPSPPLAQTVSAQVAKYRCLKSVCERARFTPLQAGVAFCPAENPGSEEPDGRAGPAAERLQKVFDLPSPSCATNRAVSGEDSIGLYDTNLEGQNDPEAMHLWSKLPDKIKSAYVYEGILGRGAYGIVILAHKKIEVGLPAQLDGEQAGTLPSRLAVKLIRTVYGAEPLAIREGLVHHSIDSPLVPKCFDYGISRGVIYIVEEFVPGVPMNKVLEQEGPLSCHEVAEVGCQVAAALSAIHAAGFVYRDVKPHNIMRVGRGRGATYRLIDFGSAAGIDGCLFGGAHNTMAPSCYLDPDPHRTRARLQALFQDMCRDADSSALPASAVQESLRAVGLRSGLVQEISTEMMKTYCHTSPCGLTEVDAVSAEEFMAMFDRLVWEQDRSYPAGTCPFMAPEQFLQGEGYSPASDLYSLGVTLFMLVTGKLPQQVSEEKAQRMTFRQSLEVWASLHDSRLDQQLPRVSSVVPGVFVGLEEAIAQALDKLPEHRQRSALDLHLQLQDALTLMHRGAVG